MEKRVYKETPLRIAVIAVLSIIGFFAVAGFLISLTPSRPMSPNEKTAAVISVAVILLVMFGTLFVMWLAIKRREVTIDTTGAEVVVKRPLGQNTGERFLWQEVAATLILSETYTVRHSTQTSYKFGVALADGRIVYLFDKTFLDLKLRNLIRDVNQATKERLGYVWEECRASETRPILAAVAPFCKIALTEEAARRNGMVNSLISPASVVSQPIRNPAAPKIETKKHLRRDWLSSLGAALILGAIATGFVGWDYYRQKNDWERMSPSTFNFKTGKSTPIEKSPFAYEFGDSGLLPVIVIVGALGAVLFAAAIHTHNKWRKTIETPEMLAEDARREKIENSPEVKEIGRQRMRGIAFRLLVFAPIIVMLFLKTHYSIYFGYLVFAALAIGVQTYLAMRR